MGGAAVCWRELLDNILRSTLDDLAKNLEHASLRAKRNNLVLCK